MSHRRSPQVPAERRRRRSRLALLVNVLIAVSLACSLPSLSRPVETPDLEPVDITAQSPSAPPEPLPPALVESDPLPGSEIALNRPITLVFNQAMDRRSVEGAITGQPTLSGRFNWQGDNTLTFTPDSPFLPGSEVVITIAETARSEMGMPLLNPMTLSYRAAGYLRLTQVLPSPGSEEVNPTSALVVSFNRPVFPIGEQAPGDAQFTQPVITIDPPVGGSGQWINTSTYIFYPEPALAGGVEYTVQLNPDLKSLDGSPLAVETGSESYGWSFTTSLPELISIQTGQEPWQTGSEAVLDPEIILIFNQPMDPQSVADHFELLDSSLEPVPVVLKASDDPNQLVFQPENLLERRSSYTVVLRAGAQDLGGTPFESEASTILSTVPPLGVDFTNPIEGGTKQTYESIVLHFSAHLGDVSLGRYISFQPDVPNLNTYLDEDRRTAYISGEFAPETNYTLTIRQDLPDAWGGSLREPYSLNFRTLPLEPTLTVGYGVDILFLSPQGATLPAQATNLGNVAFTIGSLPLGDFLHMMGPEGFDLRQTYQPLGARFVQQDLALPNNQSQVIEIALSPDGRPLSPGLYYLRFSAAGFYPPPPLLLISSNVQLTLKYSATEVLVWAVDLRGNLPVADSQVSVYDETGQLVAEGRTDESGVFRSGIAPSQNPYISLFAVLGQPGEDQFGMVLSNWNYGLADFSLGISFDYLPPRQRSYIYTDRPIYRPGQVVYFKALTRQAYNGRYSLPEEDSLEMYLYDPFGEIVRTFSLPVSEFGGVEGEYTLPFDAVPGFYRLAARSIEYVEDSVSFHVAEYRKPEIDLQVSFASQEVEAGQELLAEVTANYFFGAPASNVPVRWSLYAVREEISLFDYTVGVVDTIWLESPYSFRPGDSLGELVAQGQAATGPDGSLDLNLPTSAAGPDGPLGLRRYTLEVVVVDESEAPVYNRASILVHPARFYVGLRPDSWAARAGRELGFDLQIVDWEGQPAGEHSLNVNFRKVTWEQQEPLESDPFYLPRYRPVYESVGSVSLMTGSDGLARLALTPPEPGTYLLDISGPEVAHTSTLIWAGGPGQAIWPNLPNQRLQLIPDYDHYYPGETAQVFVPNPYGEEALALISLERGTLLRYEVISVEPEGTTLALRLGNDEAPNIYVSLTLLGTEGEKPSFRYGVVELVVEPVVQTLNVEVLGLPESPLEPGEDLTMGLRVTGASGEPVRGEFSLAVVDEAVLALAEPNSPPVLEAFYGRQPLGVRTSLSLAGDAGRLLGMPGGMGGGGEEMAFFNIREEFPDTAYWNPSIATDSSGEAWVNFSLPDSLTSWQIDVRGITADSRVGQARQSLIASKELIIRPVTPRFLVAGDRLQLAAVVHNNTAQEIEAEVSLQAVGFSLDDQFPATQLVSIPSGGRARIEWWGTVQNIDRVDLIFSASGGGLFDSARPPLGRVLLPTGERLAGGGLPVLRFTARQTFATSGVMDSAGERLELVSIPESAAVTGLRWAS
jgi:alpha-2-macroglobulin